MKYNLTITRIGYVDIEADSLQEAMSAVNNMDETDIEWMDDFTVTDYEKSVEECITILNILSGTLCTAIHTEGMKSIPQKSFVTQSLTG